MPLLSVGPSPVYPLIKTIVDAAIGDQRLKKTIRKKKDEGYDKY